jgi:putative FmdB family regulatory protein
MPTYKYACQSCDHFFSTWESIHGDAQTVCGECGGHIVRVISTVRTYGIGDRGAATRTADARDKQIERDRPAYRELRHSGHQPPFMTGSADLAARANDDWYIKTGGKMSVPDDRKAELEEMLAGGAATDWNPIETLHAKKEKV